jgi:hypothetical protein
VPHHDANVPNLDPEMVRCLDCPYDDLCMGRVRLEEGDYVCERCGCWWAKDMLDAMNIIEARAGTIPRLIGSEVI